MRLDLKIFENCVFKVSVDTKQWVKATAVRTVRSMAFTALSIIPTTGAVLGSINCIRVLSRAGTSVIVAV